MSKRWSIAPGERLRDVSQRMRKTDIQIWVILGLIAVIFVGMSAAVPNYASLLNLKIMLGNYVLEGIMALGMTLVIISGGIDLSVAGVMPFTAILFAYMLKGGIPIPAAMVLILLTAAGIGFFNDFLIQWLDVHPFVITLAVQLILKGVNVVITSGNVVSGFPEAFTNIMFLEVFGLSIPMLVLVVLAVFYFIMLRKNRYFRMVYFVGGNPTAAELSGIHTKRFFRFVYVQSAVLAGVAGIMACFVYGSANASYGTNIETRVITAVAIGGSSMIHGGIGSIAGTVLGLIFVALINGSFIMSGLSTYYQDVVTGVLLVFAVVFSERLKGIKRKT
nr:ABC transporter permease [uncultured Oscillibacter sp.]